MYNHDVTSPSTTSTMNDVAGFVHILSSTKDSLFVHWTIDDFTLQRVSGYKIRYQAVGSKVVQVSPLLEQTITNYDITMLHEDTNYNICVEVFMNNTAEKGSIYRCVEGSTSTDSLSVALGSTFGAFLAWAIIVMFVFLAKWQHTRKLRRQQLAQVTPSADSLDSMVKADADYEMSDVSLQVHEDTLKMEFSSQSSVPENPSGGVTSNGILSHMASHDEDCYDVDDEDVYDAEQEAEAQSLQGYVTVHEPPDSPCDDPCTSNGHHHYPLHELEELPDADGFLQPSPFYSFSATDALHTPTDRPPDVRPKEKALMDLTHMYANKKLFEQPQSQLRPNLSCNW